MDESTITMISAIGTAIAAIAAAGTLLFGVHTYYHAITRERCARLREKLQDIDRLCAAIDALLVEPTFVAVASAISEEVVKFAGPSCAPDSVVSVISQKNSNNAYANCVHRGLLASPVSKDISVAHDRLLNECSSLRADLPILSLLFRKTAMSYIAGVASYACSPKIYYTVASQADLLAQFEGRVKGAAMDAQIKAELADYLQAISSKFVHDHQEGITLARSLISECVEAFVNTTDKELMQRASRQKAALRNVDADSPEFAHEAIRVLVDAVKPDLLREDYEKILVGVTEIGAFAKRQIKSSSHGPK